MPAPLNALTHEWSATITIGDDGEIWTVEAGVVRIRKAADSAIPGAGIPLAPPASLVMKPGWEVQVRLEGTATAKVGRF